VEVAVADLVLRVVRIGGSPAPVAEGTSWVVVEEVVVVEGVSVATVGVPQPLWFEPRLRLCLPEVVRVILEAFFAGVR